MHGLIGTSQLTWSWVGDGFPTWTWQAGHPGRHVKLGHTAQPSYREMHWYNWKIIRASGKCGWYRGLETGRSCALPSNSCGRCLLGSRHDPKWQQIASSSQLNFNKSFIRCPCASRFRCAVKRPGGQPDPGCCERTTGYSATWDSSTPAGQ